MEWDDDVLAELYNRQPVTRDFLAYTPEFDHIVATYCARTGQQRTQREVLWHTIDRCKHDRERFLKKGRSSDARPSLLFWDVRVLERLWDEAEAEAQVGLDKLAYTPEFDQLVARYCAETGHARTHCQVYRRVMTRRKRTTK